MKMIDTEQLLTLAFQTVEKVIDVKGGNIFSLLHTKSKLNECEKVEKYLR